MAQVAHDFKEKTRTSDVIISENIDFNGLLLSEPVLKGLQDAGFVRPSPIQLKAIPLGRCGLDLIVQAKSGTGKTCVFSVIALESITTDTNSTQVLVLAPTREIAVQIWEVINSIGRAVYGLECHTFIGGLPVPEDRMKLKKCHIAVGSPGRIKQLIESGVMKTDSIRLFVLDEADKLLEESFQEQINWIYSMLPENKQMLALSATYPEYLATHLTAYMRNPTYLRLNITDPALLGIRQYFKTVPYHPMAQAVFEHKSKALVHILSSVSFQQCLVFSNLQTRAQTLADSLISQGWPTACIAGCLDQKDRNEAMAKLKTYKCRILISTDLTSRGIDADKVSLVINLDIPKDHETYLHRIGRAGRFGAFGIGITLVSEGTEKLNLDAIEKRCNTHILPLPDPLPSDLAQAKAPVCLDDVVSTELINTDSSHNNMKYNLLKETEEHSDEDVGCLEDAEEVARSTNEQVMESFEADKIKNITNGHNKYTTECGENVCDLDGDEKLTATLVNSSGSQSARDDDLSLENHGSKVVAAGQNCVGKLNVESVDDTENFKASLNLNHMSETSITDSAVEEIEQLKELSLESGDEATKEKYQEGLCQSEDTVKQSDEKVHVIFRAEDLKARVVSILEDINLSEHFRHSVGYKPLTNPYTYSTCCNALGPLSKGHCASVSTCEPKQLIENIQTGLGKCADSQRLRDVAVSLQELFDKHIDIVHEKEQENDDFREEMSTEIGQNGIGIIANEVEITKETELGVCAQASSQHQDYSKVVSSSFVNEYNLPTKYKASGVDESFGKEHKQCPVVNNETDRNIKKTESQDNEPVVKPKKQQCRIGYQGKFSIGHLLEVERNKDTKEIEMRDTMETVHSESSVKSFGSDTSEKIEENCSERKTSNAQAHEQQSYRIDMNKFSGRRTNSFNQIKNSYFEMDKKVEVEGSMSDFTESEHSGTEYTEDSDTDSTSSDNVIESKPRHQNGKHLFSKSERHRYMARHSANEVSKSMNERGTEPVPEYYEYDTNSQPSHINTGFNAYYGQHQPCQWPSYYYPDYWLPWQHYSAYQGYPGYQNFYPYHFNPSPYTSRRYDSSMSMNKVQQMQEEYIKAMCKREG